MPADTRGRKALSAMPAAASQFFNVTARIKVRAREPGANGVFLEAQLREIG